MARTINKVTLLGRVGTDPEMQYTPGGTALTKLRLATDRHRSNGDTEADWHNVVCWDKLAEAVNTYVGKGSASTSKAASSRTPGRARTASAATAPRCTPPRSCSSTAGMATAPRRRTTPPSHRPPTYNRIATPASAGAHTGLLPIYRGRPRFCSSR